MKRVFRIFGHKDNVRSFDFDLDGLGRDFRCEWSCIENDAILTVSWDAGHIKVFPSGLVQVRVNRGDGYYHSGCTMDPDFKIALLEAMSEKRESAGTFPETSGRTFLGTFPGTPPDSGFPDNVSESRGTGEICWTTSDPAWTNSGREELR